jgi:hypothetical protein
VVFLSHLPCCNRVQVPKTKSWSNACSWNICYACGGRGEGGPWMKWVGFEVSAASSTPCVGMRRGSCDCGGRWTFSSLWLPLLLDRATSSVLMKSSCCTEPLRVTKTTGALLPWFGFFRGGLSTEGMHVLDRVTRSFYTCGPIDRLVRVLPSELIGSGRTGVPSPLGFNNLLLNQPLPWRALRPAFRILSATRRCSFSLEICWASKPAAQLIFSIEN